MQIEFNFYGCGEYTVQFEGDDVWFETLEEAEKFLAEIEKQDLTDRT